MLTTEQVASLRLMPLGRHPNRLLYALELANVAQADVCRATGIDAPTLSRLVTGRSTNPFLSTAQKLARFFGCTVEDLFPQGDEDTAEAGPRGSQSN